MGYLRPYFPKIFLASDWWRASSEIFENLRKNLRKSVGKRRQGFGKGGQGKEEKKREGWVEEGKKEGRVGGARDDVIEKNKK